MHPRTSRFLPGSAASLIPAIALSVAACTQTAETPPPAGQPAPVAPFSAPAIASMAMVTNNAEIQESQIALQRSTNESVRQFAQRMVTDHQYLNQQLGWVMSEERIGSEMIPLSQQVQDESRNAQQTLQGLSGADFDRAYIDRQIQLHEWAISMIDDTLLPSATNSDLRSVLETTRATMSEHLQQARQIRATLNQSNQGGSGHHGHH